MVVENVCLLVRLGPVSDRLPTNPVFKCTANFAHQLDIGTTYIITFAVDVQFHIRDQFWIIQPKLHGACFLDFFCKISKHTCLTSRRILMFSGVFRHNSGS